MTTSQKTLFLSEALERERIPERQLEFFRARLMLRFHSMIQSTFHRLSKSRNGFSKAQLARRLGKGPDQVTRWMNSPGNLEVKTISDLLLAMGCEPVLDVRDLEAGAIPPTQEAWLRHKSRDEASNAQDILVRLAPPPAMETQNSATHTEVVESSALQKVLETATVYERPSRSSLLDLESAQMLGGLPEHPLVRSNPRFTQGTHA